MIDENLTEFGGYAVVNWKPDDAPADYSKVAVRIRLDWDEADEGLTWPDRWRPWRYYSAHRGVAFFPSHV